MVRGQWPSTAVGLLALITLVAALGGCGSGNGLPGGEEPPEPPPPVVGTAIIDGTVVDSAHPATTIAGAQVTLASETAADAPAAVTDGAGRFTLRDLAAGGVELELKFPTSGVYQAMRVTVDTAARSTTHVTIAVLRVGASTPTSVALTPSNAQIDLGGEIQFDAAVYSYGVATTLTPSFSLLGEIGSLSASGLFTATALGTGEVQAFFPLATATADVEVTAPAAPKLGTLSVSPGSVPAEGGDVTIALSATDGDGIAKAEAEITTLSRPTSKLGLALEAGNERDGSWAGVLSVPANSNPIGSDGVQLEQQYSVRVRVTDYSGASSITKWVDFIVEGLDAPPGPP